MATWFYSVTCHCHSGFWPQALAHTATEIQTTNTTLRISVLAAICVYSLCFKGYFFNSLFGQGKKNHPISALEIHLISWKCWKVLYFHRWFLVFVFHFSSGKHCSFILFNLSTKKELNLSGSSEACILRLLLERTNWVFSRYAWVLFLF